MTAIRIFESTLSVFTGLDLFMHRGSIREFGDSLHSSIVSFAVLLYILYLVFIHGDMENKRLKKGKEEKTWMF